MAGRNLWWIKLAAVLLVLISLIPLNSETVYGECVTKTTDELRYFSVDIPDYDFLGQTLTDRYYRGAYYAEIWGGTYDKSHEAVDLELFNYVDESTAAADIREYPTSVSKADWEETTFRGLPAYRRTTSLVSSEYLEYVVDLRVLDGCYVVRGYWHEKIRKYEPLTDLEKGIASVDRVVLAVLSEVNPSVLSYVEPPEVTPAPEVEEMPPEVPKPKIVVLANSIDYSLASDFFGFLENRGLDVVHAAATDFDQYKNEKFIVILGGPDAPEGVGEIVQGILTMAEGSSIRESGARVKYTKTSVWAQGQRVSIIAGAGRQETAQSHAENRDSVASEAAIEA